MLREKLFDLVIYMFHVYLKDSWKKTKNQRNMNLFLDLSVRINSHEKKFKHKCLKSQNLM